MAAVGRVAIAGGGIGGLTLAIALARRGIEARVFERAARLDTVGAGIWMPPNAMEVLGRLEVADAVRAAGMPLGRIEVGPAHGAPVLVMDLTRLAPRFGWRAVALHRARLQEILANATGTAAIELGAQAARLEQSAERGTLVLTDGRRIDADLVVGADGVHSTLRAALAPGARLRDTGQTTWRGIAAFRLPEPDRSRELWAPRHRFGYSAIGTEEVYWFATLDRDLACPPERLHTLYADFPEPVPSLLAATPPGSAFEGPLFDLAPLPTWYGGRVVLVGDAAHAMTPNLGQGGAQAIEDALSLALAVERNAGIAAALADFEGRRRRHVERIVRQARLFGRMSHWRSPWLRAARDAVLRATPAAVAERQLEALYRPAL